MQLAMVNDHGQFVLDEPKSTEYLFAISRGVHNSKNLNKIAASCCGHPDENAFNNVSGAEALFMWIESGNYTSNFHEVA